MRFDPTKLYSPQTGVIKKIFYGSDVNILCQKKITVDFPREKFNVLFIYIYVYIYREKLNAALRAAYKKLNMDIN